MTSCSTARTTFSHAIVPLTALPLVHSSADLATPVVDEKCLGVEDATTASSPRPMTLFERVERACQHDMPSELTEVQRHFPGLFNPCSAATLDACGTTILMIAASYNATRVVSTLIDVGLSIEALDDKGRTALSYAVQYGASSTIKLLIDVAGAKLVECWAPLEDGEEYGMKQVGTLLFFCIIFDCILNIKTNKNNVIFFDFENRLMRR